ncbi:hypothetical protein HYH03_004824 [Edaphochlamys debaryana]|uniref:Potassium channel tetramerisation-type BTB domain-containing protein n=1 Tax=Edaphochlamys debaryana TaxID=47281 RepID=A0A835Y718_9CHLO|nr:hypothetical protein HYH03_004824 [Edaphochlamys debaryana]|eukprot:KAG2497236.1 hypothetical protein HYH03_004824 [Edaphochlamys debaryana]
MAQVVRLGSGPGYRSAGCPAGVSRARPKRLAPGCPALRVRAVLQEPHGTAGGPSGSGGAPARPASIRWARRQRMLASEPQPGSGEDDLIELNVGGRLMQTTRSTLLQVPGSRLAAMFRKHPPAPAPPGAQGHGAPLPPASAPLALDAGGRVWLDLDPTLFQLVLRYLREIKMSGGQRRGSLPAVQPGDEGAFRSLLSYLGLLPYTNAPIPLAVAHDPLTDELLPGSPLSGAHTPHAATAPSAASAVSTSAPAPGQAGPRPQRRGRGAFNPGPTHRQPPPPLPPQQQARYLEGESAPLREHHHHHHQHHHHQYQSGGDRAQGRQAAFGRVRSGDARPFLASPVPPAPVVESVDLIPETATCSILGPGVQGAGSSSAGGSGSGAGGSGRGGAARGESASASASAAASAGAASASASAGTGLAGRWASSRSDGDAGTGSSSSSSSRGGAGGGSSGTSSSGTGTSAGAYSARTTPSGLRRPPQGPGSRGEGGGAGAGAGASAPPPGRRGLSFPGPGAEQPFAASLAADPPSRSAAAVSQLFYISTDYSEARGLRVSVYTEHDLRAGSSPSSPSPSASAPSSSSASASAAASSLGGAALEPFDIFVDATYGDSQLSLTFVSRRELLPGGVFLGLTSRAQLDRKGARIPCYGWKSNGCTYNDHTGGGTVGRAGAWAGLGGARPAGPGGARDAGGLEAAGQAAAQQGLELEQPLWRKGDSVELIMRQGAQHNQLLLKVNGRHVDVINRLPSFKNWSWYVGLWAGGDISCAVFQRDQYAVYWGDYAVKRYL